MTNTDILAYVAGLSENEVTQLIDQIEVCLLNGAVISKGTREARFQDGIKCPHCEGKAIKHGSSAGKQRYLCKVCHKTFGDLTKSVLSGTHLSLQTWRRYAEHVILGTSLEQIHLSLGISVKTAFYMRHKIFEAIQRADSTQSLSGTIEIDETYFNESFKGRHKYFKLPRSPHTRGMKSHTRGLNGDLVCVAFGVDSSKNIMSAPIGNGMPTKKKLASFYGSRIEAGSTVHSDSLRGYGKMLRELSVKHIAVKAGSWKNGSYHLENINNIHSDCKRRLNRIHNGVSTKFLNHYLYWYKWVHDHTGKRMEALSKDLFLCGSYTVSGAKMNDFNSLARRVI